MKQPLPRQWLGREHLAAGHGHWAVAWCSVGGPHHDNQDVAGLCWREPGTHAGLNVAVADGVTQGAAGAVAAQALVSHWLPGPSTTPSSDHDKVAFLQAAEPAVARAIAAVTPQTGAATGAACWLAGDGSGWFTRVGDCRVLHLKYTVQADAATEPVQASPWHCVPMLPDQSLGLLYPDVVAQAAPGSLDPTQPAHMVGCHRLGEPEWRTLLLAPGDMLLLCSDGLHTMLSHASIEQHVAQHLDAAKTFNEVTLQNLCKALVRSAQAAGGEDDITALLLVYRPNACRPFVAA